MLETVQHLQHAGMKRAVCIGVHGIFSGDAFMQLEQVADVITTQCIPLPSNRIDIAQPLSEATLLLLKK